MLCWKLSQAESALSRMHRYLYRAYFPKTPTSLRSDNTRIDRSTMEWIPTQCLHPMCRQHTKHFDPSPWPGIRNFNGNRRVALYWVIIFNIDMRFVNSIQCGTWNSEWLRLKGCKSCVPAIDCLGSQRRSCLLTNCFHLRLHCSCIRTLKVHKS